MLNKKLIIFTLLLIFSVLFISGVVNIFPTVTYNSTDTNVTQENQFAHLNLTNDSLVLYMPFDVQENSSNITFDYSTNNNDGTVYGVTFNQTGGVYGGAYEFDGVNDYIDIGSGLNLTVLDESFCVWIKNGYADTGNRRRIIQHLEYVSSLDNNGFLLEYRGDASLGLYRLAKFNNGAVNLEFTNTSTDWQFLCGVMNSTGAFFYRNAGLVDSTATPGASNNGDRSISISNPLYTFNGSIDEVMIFNRSLSQTEIQQIYNSTYSRFYPTGEMLFQNLNFGTNNTVNISIPQCQQYNGSQLSFKINDGDFSTLNSSCAFDVYNITGDLTDANLTLRFNSTADNYFYSPVLLGNISLNDYSISGADTTPPTFTTIPTNSTIIYGNETLGVDFDATDETLFDTFFINWTNTFSINSTGWLANTSVLGVGVYEINVSANDSSGNINYTIYQVTVTQNPSSCNVLFNETSPIIYPNTFLVWTNCTSGAVLYRNGSQITNNSVQSLEAGSWNFTVLRNDSVNYSNTFNWSLFTINQATLTGSLSGTASITYGTSGDVQGSESNSGDSDVVYTLSRNGTAVSNPDTTVLAVGTYLYVYNSTGGNNWSSNSSIDEFNLTVTQNTSSCNVLFNETSPIEYPNTFLVWTNCTSGAVLYRNGTQILNNSEQSLAVGSWNFTVVRNDSVNYSNIYNEELFSILADITPPSINSYSITSSLTSGETATIRSNVTDANLETIWVTINNTEDILTNYTLSQEGSSDFYNASFVAGKVGNYTYKIYANDSQGNLNDSLGWLSFSVSSPSATPQNEVYPNYALPSSTIVITADLSAVDFLNSMNVTLNVPSGFEFFLSDYNQTQEMGNISALSTITARWLVSVPNNESIYIFNVTWTDYYNNSFHGDNKQINVIYDSTNLTNATNINIISFPELEAGGVLNSETQVRDINGDFVNASSVKISLYDPNDNLVVDSVNFISQFGTGRYFYNYTTPSTPTGQWIIYVNVTRNGNSFYDREYFRLTGGPFDIRDITVLDATAPDLSISAILENMGDGVTDIIIDWNLTRIDTGELLDSGRDTIGVSTEQTYTIAPSTSYTGETQITFLGTWSSTEKAGAQKTFTISPASSTGSSSSGGSSGGSGYTGKATSEVVCNTPYIRYGTDCCLDINNNSICDQDEKKIDSELEDFDNETNSPSKETLINKVYENINKFIGKIKLYSKENPYPLLAGEILLLVFITLLIFHITHKIKNKARKIDKLEIKLRHLKELKNKKKISDKSYHSVRDELLQRTNSLLKNRALMLVLGSFLIIFLCSIFSGNALTGSIINLGGTDYNPIYLLLTVLILLAIILYLFKKDLKINFTFSRKRYNLPPGKKDYLMQVRKLKNKKVYSLSGDYFGIIKDVILNKDKIDELGIKTPKKKKIKFKYKFVKGVGDVIVLKSG